MSYDGQFGGVVTIRPEMFRRINGFPIVYFSSGGEDDDMGSRFCTFVLCSSSSSSCSSSCCCCWHVVLEVVAAVADVAVCYSRVDKHIAAQNVQEAYNSIDQWNKLLVNASVSEIAHLIPCCQEAAAWKLNLTFRQL